MEEEKSRLVDASIGMNDKFCGLESRAFVASHPNLIGFGFFGRSSPNGIRLLLLGHRPRPVGRREECLVRDSNSNLEGDLGRGI